MGANPATPDSKGLIALHYAATGGNPEIIEFLHNTNKTLINTIPPNKKNLKNKVLVKKTALHIACTEGHFPAVKKLVELGANITATNTLGWTPLYCAVISAKFNPKIIEFLHNKNKNLINMPNNKELSGKTALHGACLNGNLEAVKLLIKLGANITATDNRRRTAFHCAAHKGNLPIIEYLHSKNPSLITMQNNQGETPARTAALNNKKGALRKILELTKLAIDNQKNMLSTIMNAPTETIKKSNKPTPKKQRNLKKTSKNLLPEKDSLQKQDLILKTDTLTEKTSSNKPSPLSNIPTKSEISALLDYQNKTTVTTPDKKLLVLYRTWENAGGGATILIKKPKKTGTLGTALLNLNTASPKKQDVFHKAVVSMLSQQWLLDYGRILTYSTSSPNDQNFIHYSKKYGIHINELEDGDILVLFPGFLCTGNSASTLFNTAKEKALKGSLPSEAIRAYFKQQAKNDTHIHKGTGLCIIRNSDKDGTKTVIHSCFENESSSLN